ncbi:MAG: hypothetical protein PHE27_04835, partial [Alphaproteobacteria bacterium]|nr:hypothetical protein [Alphaproteobacteria bacterium]
AFELFAAPEVLHPSARTGRSFRAAAEEVASLRNWHGNDGIYLSTERDLFSAIRKGDYVGQWFIPTVEHLVGMRLEGFNPLEGRKASSNNLCDLQDRGAFRDTFGPGYYWSITPEHRAKVFGHEGRFLMVSLTGGFGYLGHADESSLGKNVRPVRAEPRRPFALASPAP